MDPRLPSTARDPFAVPKTAAVPTTPDVPVAGPGAAAATPESDQQQLSHAAAVQHPHVAPQLDEATRRAAEILGQRHGAAPAPAHPHAAAAPAVNTAPDANGVYSHVPTPPPRGHFKLRTDEGKVVDVRMTYLDEKRVHVQLEGHQFNIVMGHGVAPMKLELVVKFMADMPKKMRESNAEVTFHAGPDPDDGEFQRRFHDPGFHCAATGGGGSIDLYNNQIDKGTMLHEGAHNLASKYFGDCDPRKATLPNADAKAWEGAIKEDLAIAKHAGGKGSGYPSDYAKEVRETTDSDGEDFAEASRVFLEAKKKGPAAIEAFTKQFPHRAVLLGHIYTDD